MDRRLRLCLVNVDAPLVEAFEALGHEVLLLMPASGTTPNLPKLLAANKFEPDAVIQQELLGPRVLLAGLEDIPGLRAFWARDPHLNAYWQAPYARLFDVTFSTQEHAIPALAACGAERIVPLPWFAPSRPFRPHKQRARAAGFAGRLGPTRPVRAWLAECMHGLLGEDFALVEDLSFEAMLDFYMDCRMVPNESLAGEVNFRLFEAAGCGCVVLGQNLGPAQEALFTPGREMLVCGDSLELAGAVAMLEKRPHLAEALGHAAWTRVQAEHLPASRARVMLKTLDETPRTAPRATALAGAPEARGWFLLASAGLMEAGRLKITEKALAASQADLAALPVQDELALTAQVRVASLSKDPKVAAEVYARAVAQCERLAGGGSAPVPLRLVLACAMLALRQGLRPILAAKGSAGKDAAARDLAGQGEWLARALALSAQAGVEILPQASPENPPEALLMAWARRLEGAGLPTRGGFPFEPGQHLPATPGECLYWAAALAPNDVVVLRALADHLAAVPGADALLLGALSELGLRQTQDWRVGLATGLCDLRVFRTEAGFSELALAASLATAQKQGPAFAAELAAADPSGRIRRALAAGQARK